MRHWHGNWQRLASDFTEIISGCSLRTRTNLNKFRITARVTAVNGRLHARVAAKVAARVVARVVARIAARLTSRVAARMTAREQLPKQFVRNLKDSNLLSSDL